MEQDKTIDASTRHCNNESMRLTDEQIQAIRQLTRQIAGKDHRIRLFGSRLDDASHGGDIDLFLELQQPAENPALLAAKLAASVSRLMQGRKVDVLISAPNLCHLPIHDIALRDGVLL